MDFFTSQNFAKQRTAALVVYFVLGVLGLIAAIYVVCLLLFATAPQTDDLRESPPVIYFNPELLLGVTMVTLSIVGAGSLYKSFQLAQGGETVALMMGGRPINTDSRNPQERRVLNVVEEMAIASGVPVPPVYLMDNELGINAFAAGLRPTNAVIGVTRGTIEKLNRDELQGVIAHEFSHILNGDMKLNIRLAGLIHGILVISMIGYYILRTGSHVTVSSESKDKGGSSGAAFYLFGLALLILGYIGVIFGQLIRAAVSRQREYLADASAVQFTRNPDGIAGALKKIAAYSAGSRIHDAHAQELSHLFFSTAVSQVFATHPPLDDRIKKIDPNWDGKLPEVKNVDANEDRIDRRQRPSASPLPMRFDSVMERVGEPSSQNISTASSLLTDIPTIIDEAAHEAFSAQAVLFGMLMNQDSHYRSKQLSSLQREIDPPIYEETLRLLPEIQRLDRAVRLPTIELLIPALKSLSRAQYIRFRDNVFNLVSADKKVTLFEYVLQLFVIRCLDEHFRIRQPVVAKINDLEMLRSDLNNVLALMAYVGQPDESVAAEAYRDAIQSLDDGSTRPMPRLIDVNLAVFGQSLDTLAHATPNIKRRILAAATRVAVHDATVTVAEYELLRAIASVLDCPMPPVPISELAEPIKTT